MAAILITIAVQIVTAALTVALAATVVAITAIHVVKKRALLSVSEGPFLISTIYNPSLHQNSGYYRIYHSIYYNIV